MNADKPQPLFMPVLGLEVAVAEAVAAIDKVRRLVEALDELAVPLEDETTFRENDPASLALRPLYDAGVSFGRAHENWKNVRLQIQMADHKIEEARAHREGRDVK